MKKIDITGKKLETICQHYGIRKQIKKLSEEVFELQEAVIDADQEWHSSTDNPLVEIERPIIQHIAKNQGHIAEELAMCDGIVGANKTLPRSANSSRKRHYERENRKTT